MNEKYLIELFGNEWYQALKPYLLSKEFLKLGTTINKIRMDTEIYPAKENIFRVFRETPLKDIKVVFLGIEPYNQKDIATGIAYDNRDSLRISNDLKYIFEEINNSYPERQYNIHKGLDDYDLSYWISQGVFLYNIALTSEKNKSQAHWDLWIEFSKEVFKVLNKQPDIIWLLLGKTVQKIKTIITNNSHRVIEAASPNSCFYNPDSGFLDSGVFRKINFQLDQKGKLEINW